jgi:hypothetical protein
MLSKEKYIDRPEDIDLGPTFNAMRRRQRELGWPHYWMNSQMANVRFTRGIYGPIESVLGLGLGF